MKKLSDLEPHVYSHFDHEIYEEEKDWPLWKSAIIFLVIGLTAAALTIAAYHIGLHFRN